MATNEYYRAYIQRDYVKFRRAAYAKKYNERPDVITRRNLRRKLRRAGLTKDEIDAELKND